MVLLKPCCLAVRVRLKGKFGRFRHGPATVYRHQQEHAVAFRIATGTVKNREGLKDKPGVRRPACFNITVRPTGCWGGGWACFIRNVWNRSDPLVLEGAEGVLWHFIMKAFLTAEQAAGDAFLCRIYKEIQDQGDQE
jgi:hypothetical protein